MYVLTCCYCIRPALPWLHQRTATRTGGEQPMDNRTNFAERDRNPAPRSWSLVWPALSCAGAVLAAVWLGLLWRRPAASWQEWLVPCVLALASVLGGVWQLRARARRRWRAAVDAYADREIARARRRHGPQRLRPPAPGRRAWANPADL